MSAQPLEIHIDPESETGKILAHAEERPLRFVSNGRRYRVEPEAILEDEEDDPFANYDPARAAAAWRATFGTLRGIDLEAFKAEMREQRGQDSAGQPDW